MENQTEKTIRKPRKPAKRSPGYPMISLEEAIQKAKILWDKDKNNYIPLVAAYEHLGYKAKGSYGTRIMSALKKFDLISEKQDDIKLTDEAVDLALHNPSDERYIEIIKKLALKPTIYEKIFNKYNGTLPSDATLRIELIKEHGFNPESVEDFLISFRKSIEFAGLSQDNKELEKGGKDRIPPNKEDRMIMSKDLGHGIDSSKLVIEIPIPLSPTELVTIKAPYPLTESQWQQMVSILDAYKPSFVQVQGQKENETKEN
jgi:hypothetical protein